MHSLFHRSYSVNQRLMPESGKASACRDSRDECNASRRSTPRQADACRSRWQRTRRSVSRAVLLAVLCSCLPLSADDASAIRILERRCIQCHDAAEGKGELSLEVREAALQGGDTGPAIVPGKLEESLLWQQITGDTPDMPKGAAPLTTAERETIREWILAGANWPAAPLRDRRHEVTDWWSFQPLKRPEVPTVAFFSEKERRVPGSEDSAEGPERKGEDIQSQGHAQSLLTLPPLHKERPFSEKKATIDAFLQQAQVKAGLTPSDEADRTTLIRRLSFDLIGLPPTPDEVQAFLADSEPNAYERLVNRLLDNPGYGERWARHWLDVVHFGETHGYDKDKLRLNAWPYRDYVIRALNEDRPYRRFIEEQLAGDVLYPGTADGIEGLGFIAAGPWDFIGHAEVPESKTDGKIARHLDRDDMITNTIQSFCSLTVQCAQCHNHKFDPISQEDYYALQGVFAAVDRTDRAYDRDPEVTARRNLTIQKRKANSIRQAEIEQSMRTRAGEKLVEIDKSLLALIKQAEMSNRSPVEFGWHSGIELRPDVEKWVQVDLPQSLIIHEIILRPARDDFNDIGDGFGFPTEYRVQVADDAAFKLNVRTVAEKIISQADLNAVRIQFDPLSGMAIRVTASKLALRWKDDYIFALAELEALGVDNQNVALHASVTSLDSIEASPRWGRRNLTDGLFPGPDREVAERLATGRADRARLVNESMTPEERAERARLSQEAKGSFEELMSHPRPLVAYVGSVHTGSGSFTGTGANGGKPRPIFRLARGSVTQPLEEVGPGAISAVTVLAARFDLPADHKEGERRAALARWIASPDNPLTWRSAVNRVWQYHFGRGLVETTNDFGKNGGLPSHPELLDWLACDLREHQSLKQLHRAIVMSAAYRQVSTIDPAMAEIDSDNRLLWRMNRRRLEAEPLRDGVLATAGLLNRQMYGPSFQDFVIEKPEHSPHYEYHLHDPNDPSCFRRSVYRFLVRSQPEPFMASLDCADPSMQVERRNESASPLQALSLWNDAFMLTAGRLAEERAKLYSQSLDDQVADAWYACFSRPILPEDQKILSQLASEHGMGSVWRVLWNSNQFVFVD